MELLQGWGWRILATGFEAGTIGALADWFAVSALFHRIPIPLINRHTNIIVKNRQKLTEAIVELVTTKWLSPGIIHEKLQGLGIAEGIIKLLQKPGNLDLTMNVTRDLLLRLMDNLDNPQVLILFRNTMKEQIGNLEVARPLGIWLESIIVHRDHHPIVDRLLKESTKALDDPSTHALIREKLRSVLKSYEKKDLIKKAAVRLGKWTGGIDLDMLTDRLLDMAHLMADEADANPGHPLRQRLDQSLMELAYNLKEGDPSTIAWVDRLKQKIVEDKQVQAIFLATVNRLKFSIKEQLSKNESSLMILLRKKAEQSIEELQADQSALRQIDDWLKETVAQLVNKYHPEVGNMVRDSLLKLNDKELVGQIKDKVGDDLQYIRLNGAVVGGMVGILIAVARLIFLH